MTLGQKQELFARLFGDLIVWVYAQGLALRIGEVHRPQILADLYADMKPPKGIKNSAHTRKLAADIFLVKDGAVTWETSDYEPLGSHWKSLHELCRWGGDFRNRDAVHFSVEHGGVK